MDQDDDRNSFQIWVVLDLSQYFVAILSRKFEVKQNQVGPGNASVFSFTAQKRDRLHAVFDQRDVIAHSTFLKCVNCQRRFVRIVFHKENFDWSPID